MAKKMKIPMKIEKVTVVAKTPRPAVASWILEQMQDLERQEHQDLEQVMDQTLREEIDREIIEQLRALPKKDIK